MARRALSRQEAAKERCRQKCRNMVAAGILIRGDCYFCGRFDDIQAHHPDYRRPAYVLWVCGFHHRQGHYRGLLPQVFPHPPQFQKPKKPALRQPNDAVNRLERLRLYWLKKSVRPGSSVW